MPVPPFTPSLPTMPSRRTTCYLVATAVCVPTVLGQLIAQTVSQLQFWMIMIDFGEGNGGRQWQLL